MYLIKRSKYCLRIPKHADVRGMMAIYEHKTQAEINWDRRNGM